MENPKRRKYSVCLILEYRKDQIFSKHHSNLYKGLKKYPEAYLEQSQTSMMEFCFEKVVNGSKPLTIFTQSSTVDAWHGF